MQNRISIVLDEEEYDALWKFCSTDLRTPMAELRYLLRRKMNYHKRKQARETISKRTTINENKL